MKWITREKIKVDRVARPWLIKILSIWRQSLSSCRTTRIGMLSRTPSYSDVPRDVFACRRDARRQCLLDDNIAQVLLRDHLAFRLIL